MTSRKRLFVDWRCASAARQLQDFQLISFPAGKRPFDKPVRMVPLAQGRNLAPSGLKVTVPADITRVIPQDGLGGFHGEFTFIVLAQLPDTPFPGQG